MAWTPQTNVFNSAFGGGMQNARSLVDLVQNRREANARSGLAELARQGDFAALGAGLINNGQYGAGMSAINVPYNREQQALQRDFQNAQFMDNRDFRNRSFDADQGYRAEQLRLAQQKAEADLAASDPNNPNYRPEHTAPIQVIDPETQQPVWVQPRKDGGYTSMGVSPNNPIKTIDNGTEIISIDSRTNQVIGRVKKENYQEAYDTKSGALQATSTAENRSEYSTMVSKMPGLRAVVAQLDELADKATYTQVGQATNYLRAQAGMEPSDSAVARTEYIAMVDNQVLPLLRDTFGAAFTVKEGETLRATLGAADKSPKEKKAVLRAFIAQKERDILAKESRLLGKVDALGSKQQPRDAGSNAKPINVPSPQDAGKSRETAITISSEDEAENLKAGTYFILNGRVGVVE